MKSLQRCIASGKTQKRLLYLILSVVVSLAVIKTSIPFLENFLIVNKPLQRAEALVVMAGSTRQCLPGAARLFHDGVAPRILLTNGCIFSAWSPEHHRNLNGMEWAELELMKLQVPQQAIVKLKYSSSGSIHDALNCREEILSKGLKSIIIVASDYRTRRSLWTFERVLHNQDVAIGSYPAVSEEVASSDFQRFFELASELIGYMYYTVMYQDIE